MSTNVDGLGRLRRAFVAASPADMPRADCPPASKIWKGVRGELAPSGLREMIHHVASCTVCTEAWRLAEELEEGCEKRVEDGTDETPARPSTSRFGWFGRSSGASAVAVAMVLLVVAVDLRDRGNSAPVLRGSKGSPTLSTDQPEASVIELLNLEPLSREDFVLRWQGPENAEYYQLRVSPAADLMSMVAEEPEWKALEYRISPTKLAGLRPNVKLKVYLKAVHSIEGVLGDATFDIEVR